MSLSVPSADDVRQIVREELAALRSAPALLTRKALAAKLDCSVRHVANLQRAGIPCVYLGDSPRFELGAVLEWLKGRAA